MAKGLMGFIENVFGWCRKRFSAGRKSGARKIKRMRTTLCTLRDLRTGVYDVVVGINLLREGLDLPEVSLVAILDADREGFLRSARSLIQTAGRAARNVNGRVVMYADRLTDSMQRAIEETDRRRHHVGIDIAQHPGPSV